MIINGKENERIINYIFTDFVFPDKPPCGKILNKYPISSCESVLVYKWVHLVTINISVLDKIYKGKTQ